MTPVLVRMAAELLAQIDGERGDVPRAVWIRRACERALMLETNIRLSGLSAGANPSRAIPMKPARVDAPKRVKADIPAVMVGPPRVVAGSRLKKPKGSK